MFHLESIQRNILLIGMGTAALLSAPASAQGGLSPKRQNFISFTPGEAGVALGAWTAPGVKDGQLHGAMSDGGDAYLLELNGVVIENAYLVGGENPQGQTFGVISTYDGFHHEAVAYFIGVWEEVMPGQGEVMATIYRLVNDGLGAHYELAGLMAGDFILEGTPIEGNLIASQFEGIDGVDADGLDELNDGPTSVGIDKLHWAGGPPILVSDLMWSSLRRLKDEYQSAGLGDLEQNIWVGGPPIKKFTELEATKIRKFVDLKAKVALDDDVSIDDGGGLGSGVGADKKDADGVVRLGDKSAIGVQSKGGDFPDVGTFRLRWKMFFE